MIEAIGRDLRFAARGLRRSPGFTAAAVLPQAVQAVRDSLARIRTMTGGLESVLKLR